MGCRDCDRCVECTAEWLFAIPFRFAFWLLTFWNVRMFWRFCPRCGHRLKVHRKVQGRFVD